MNDKQEINKQQTKFLTNNKHLLTKVETNKKESESKQTTKKFKNRNRRANNSKTTNDQ